MNQTYLKEHIKEELSGAKDYIIMEDCMDEITEMYMECSSTIKKMHEMYNR